MYFKNKSQKDDSVNSGVSNIRSVIKKIGLVFLAVFLAVVVFVVCKLYSIQSVISSNMDLISSVSTPLSAQKVLFDQTYTDADFKRDLKNFEVVNIHKPYYKSMNMYMILTNAQKYTGKVSTEEYQRLSEKNDTVGLNNLMKLRIHERTLAWSLINMGANFMTVFFMMMLKKHINKNMERNLILNILFIDKLFITIMESLLMMKKLLKVKKNITSNKLF